MSEPTPPRRPPASPYMLTLVLFGFAVWFFYDGWFNPEIEAIWFNRIGAPVLFAIAIWDGLRMRRRLRERDAARAAQAEAARADGKGISDSPG